MKKREVIILLGVFVIMVLTYIFIPIINKYSENKLKNQEIKGVVKDKYNDKWNHNVPKILLSNGRTLVIDRWGDQNNDIWYYIEKGDSIYKKEGSLNLEVIKPSMKGIIFKYSE
jgi:hypothetical protein